MTSPPEEKHRPEIDEGIRKFMVLILSYVDGLHNRSIIMHKELNRLKYLLELKKAKRLATGTEESGPYGIDMIDVEAEQKRFETKRKMYVGKLNKQEIKAPKLETLRYYNLKFDKETSSYAMLN